jgi:hypothetical protein
VFMTMENSFWIHLVFGWRILTLEFSTEGRFWIGISDSEFRSKLPKALKLNGSVFFPRSSE